MCPSLVFLCTSKVHFSAFIIGIIFLSHLAILLMRYFQNFYAYSLTIDIHNTFRSDVPPDEQPELFQGYLQQKNEIAMMLVIAQIQKFITIENDIMNTYMCIFTLNFHLLTLRYAPQFCLSPNKLLGRYTFASNILFSAWNNPTWPSVTLVTAAIPAAKTLSDSLWIKF